MIFFFDSDLKVPCALCFRSRAKSGKETTGRTTNGATNGATNSQCRLLGSLRDARSMAGHGNCNPCVFFFSSYGYLECKKLCLSQKCTVWLRILLQKKAIRPIKKHHFRVSPATNLWIYLTKPNGFAFEAVRTGRNVAFAMRNIGKRSFWNSRGPERQNARGAKSRF